MVKRAVAAIVVSLVLAAGALAKKHDPALPEFVLQAHTVAVMIDPGAGMSADDPRANQIAEKDVEAALVKWGRFTPVISPKGADIVIVIRKGSNRAVSDAISPPSQNDRNGALTATDNNTPLAAQRARMPDATGGGSSDPTMRDSAHPQIEGAMANDSFVVHRGDALDPVDSAVGWTYAAKDGLRPHDVPAVEEFRKAVAAAEKAAAAAAKTP